MVEADEPRGKGIQDVRTSAPDLGPKSKHGVRLGMSDSFAKTRREQVGILGCSNVLLQRMYKWRFLVYTKRLRIYE